MLHPPPRAAGPRARAPPGKAPAAPEAPPRTPLPAAVGASPRPPLAPRVRSAPASCAPAFRVSRGHKKRASPHHPAPEAPPRAPLPAAVGASPRPPLAPWARSAPPPLRASVSSALLAQETRLSAPRSPPRRATLTAPPCARSPAARATSRRGRRVPAPTARAMGAVCPGQLRASVSSVQRTQETRHAAPTPARRRASRPHQPVRGLEGRSPPK